MPKAKSSTKAAVADAIQAAAEAVQVAAEAVAAAAGTDASSADEPDEPDAPHTLLESAHETEHADFIKTPTTIEGFHNLMHIFLDQQPPALVAETIETLKRAGIYEPFIEKRRGEFTTEKPSDYAKGFLSGLSLANTVLTTLMRVNATQVVEGTKDAPHEVKVSALTQVFQSTIEAGMISNAITRAALEAYDLKGTKHADFLNDVIDNNDHIVHVYGMALAEMIIAETTVPEGATIN